MSDGRNILITGASGHIGTKLRRYLDTRGQVDLKLIDKDPKGDRTIIAADLAHYEESWTRHLQGVDTVVHLAAQAQPDAGWQDLEGPNVDAVINVYEACADRCVRRLVFASSMHAVTDDLRRKQTVTTSPPASPGNLYGATKVVGERLGNSYAERHGLSVICLRLGWVRPDDYRPGGDMGAGWAQQLWLSDRDLCRGVERAIFVEDVPFAVLNLTSNNANPPWDLAQTSRTLELALQDEHHPVPEPWTARLRRGIGRLIS
ncbi:MAG: SDR family oxidoreductase [Salinisphaera sp.]|nr:SDR family oxidoreductase [Salinisphaera sp.]